MRDLYKKPLGDILIARGLITDSQLESALEEQKRTHKKLGEVLIALGILSEEQITEIRALQLDVSYVNLQSEIIEANAIALVSETLARSNKLLPVRRTGDKLIIAMVNPLDIEAIDVVQFETKCRIESALATEHRIIEGINRNYGNENSDDLQQCMVRAALDIEVSPVTDSDDLNDDIDEVKRQSHRAPIIKVVNYILSQAVRKNASDIHIEPRRNNVDVRFRIDGELHMIKSIPKSLQPAVCSRIKIMSELDISERRLPQDGRISARIDDKLIDLRVSTSPSLYGERIVLRVLDRSAGLIPLEYLGFSEGEMVRFNRILSHPHGIVLVTGPTGSGKTTSLYAALNTLKSERTNIMTVEDPIEYELDGINQTNVHHKIGLTFANQLRAILRQDPDIVLVGEIRDGETADVAFRAALTGHLVLSTLHCNDAPSAITRLIDMELESFLVGSAINGVIAQRLVRKLCENCREAYEPSDHDKRVLGLPMSNDTRLYRTVGCDHCNNTGYRGRTTISETMVLNDEIRGLALRKATSSEIRHAAINNGMVEMRTDCAKKVLAGITTVDELQRKIFVETDILHGITHRKAA